MHEIDLQQENRLLREQLNQGQPGFGRLIGLSAKMLRVYKTFEKVSAHEYPVLVLGESGTGKELIARSLHMLPQGGQVRLETIAALAVRLRETVRRLSQEWETRDENGRARRA